MVCQPALQKQRSSGSSLSLAFLPRFGLLASHPDLVSYTTNLIGMMPSPEHIHSDHPCRPTTSSRNRLRKALTLPPLGSICHSCQILPSQRLCKPVCTPINSLLPHLLACVFSRHQPLQLLSASSAPLEATSSHHPLLSQLWQLEDVSSSIIIATCQVKQNEIFLKRIVLCTVILHSHVAEENFLNLPADLLRVCLQPLWSMR